MLLKSFYQRLLAVVFSLGILISIGLVPALAASRSTSQFSTVNGASTQVIPYLTLSSRYNLLVLDIQRPSFSNVEYIHYNLNYTTSAQGNIRGAEGTIYPWLASVKSQIQYWGGQPFFREYIPLGSCSKGVCTYDPNPGSFKVTVDTKYFNNPVTEATVVTVAK